MSHDGAVTAVRGLRAILATATERTVAASPPSIVVRDFDTVSEALRAGHERLRDASPDSVSAVVDVIEVERGPADVGAESSASPGVRAIGLLRAAAAGQMLVSGPAADVVTGPPDGIVLAGLGLHRVFGSERPIPVFEAVGAGLVRSPISSAVDGLPVAVTPLIGRVDLLAETLAAVPTARLTTFTGAGGSGKTRLALEVATLASAAFESVQWVELGSLAAAGHVLGEIAARLGLSVGRSDGLLDRVVDALRTGPRLLVLDNAEHVLDDVAATSGGLLARCPDLAILVTSREALGVDGEVVRAVPPLGLPLAPTAADVADSDAGAFLLDRIERAVGRVELDDSAADSLHRICHRLDGIPLALELVAARRAMLSLEQLADGLDDRFALLTATRRDTMPRQRTLEASVRWSHDLLGDDERVVFRRLAAFSGTFRLTDAIEVIGPDVARAGVIVGRLVDRSLVAPSGDGDLRLLETVRSFAEDRLAESGETLDTRDRHLRWLLDLAADLAPTFDGPDPAKGVTMTRRLLDDVRAAVAHAESTGHVADLWLLLDRVTLYFFYQGNVDEALRWFDRADALDTGDDLAASACARVSAALLATSRGDHDEIVGAIDRAMTAALAAGDRRAEGRSLVLSGAHQTWNAPSDGRDTLDRGRELCAELDDHAWSAWGSCGAALALTFLGRPIEAIEELETAERSARRLGSRRLALDVLARRCICEYQLGRWDAAAATIATGRELAAEFAGISVTACFDAVGSWLDIMRGHAPRAVEDMDAAIARYLREGELQFVPLFVVVRSDALVVDGRADEAIEPLTQLRRHPGVEWSAIYRHWLDHALAVALVETDRRAEARAVATRLVADAEEVGNGLDAARGRILLARLDEHGAEIRRAERLAHDALATLVDLGARPAALDALDVLSRLDDLCGHSERADAVADGVVEARARLVVGADVDLGPVVELVRRGRGRRRRPDFGWDSLTPTEIAVVGLVAESLTNPQIAERMVVGRATVKTHVSNALRKLDLTSRTQLATEYRRRVAAPAHGPGDPPPG